MDIYTKAFADHGITGLGLVIHTDMTIDGNPADAYVGLDSQRLYILYGDEAVHKIDGPKRLENRFTPRELVIHELADLKELKVERLISTAHLLSAGKEPGDETVLLLFSIGLCPQVEKIIKAVKNLKDGNDMLAEIRVEDDLFCPKCHMRYPEPERKICPKCLNKMSVSLRLMSFFKDYALKVFAVLTGMIVLTVFGIISPLISTKIFFDDVLAIGGKYFGAIFYFIMLYFLIKLFGTIVNVINSYILASAIPWIVYDLKLKIFSAMQRLSVGFYSSKQTGGLMDRVNKDSNNIYWFFVDGLPYVVVNLFIFIAVLGMMCWQNLKLALVVVFILPTSMLCFKMLFNFFRRFHHRHWTYNAQLSSLVSDTLNGQRVIKAFAMEDQGTTRFNDIGEKMTGVEIQNINMGFTAFPLIYLYMFLGQAVITAIGGIMVVNGEITLGTLMTFIAYLQMLYGPLDFMSWVSNWWSRCVDSAQRVFEIIDAKTELTEPENPVILKEFAGEIDIKDVKFGYEPANPVIKSMNLNIPGGQMLGVVGKTGAGKTTIANLIARLYDVEEGSVSIDGVNVKQLSLEQLRKNIGIVSQEMYLFIGTIADNIRYAKPDADLSEVIAAAKAASAHDFIMKLPDAYETWIGAGGQDLSGGERQRLSIARTIIQDPKILILDEATAAMDVETEANIQQAFASLKKGRTTIAIAHRLSTLRDAESIAVINEGKVVETGTHEELMIKKGEYHKLYTIQMEALKTVAMDG